MLSTSERELIVKLHLQGKKQQEIADLVGCSQPTVNLWIHRRESKQGLQTIPRSGRPTKLKGETFELVKKKILDKINSANADFGCVSTKEIKDVIVKEVGVVYSLRHVERLMHRMGFSLITPRPQHVRHDQEKVDAFRDAFKKKFPKNTWVMNSSPSTR